MYIGKRDIGFLGEVDVFIWSVAGWWRGFCPGL